MQLTNEEMETLNRATEILSRYVNNGSVDREEFELFERLVVSAIDSGDRDEEKRRKIISAPYTALVLHCLYGYVSDEGKTELHLDPNIVNITFDDCRVSFDVLSEKMRSIIKKHKYFTIAPMLRLVKDGKDFLLDEENPSMLDTDVCSCALSQNANETLLTRLPIVFECGFDIIPDEPFQFHFSAKILNITAPLSSFDTNGNFDIIRAWSKMTWHEA